LISVAVCLGEDGFPFNAERVSHQTDEMVFPFRFERRELIEFGNFERTLRTAGYPPTALTMPQALQTVRKTVSGEPVVVERSAQIAFFYDLSLQSFHCDFFRGTRCNCR
jgi:hypothetical protein